tara:strand:+ start:303 stop:977 length:675 start_codon:yes stop_codon:yes gene_type:complete
MKTINALESLLYPSTAENTRTQVNHPYSKGMFISINNHKCTSGDLFSLYAKQYQTLVYGLTRENISRECIKVSAGRLPRRDVVMDLVNKKYLLVVAGIHDYKPLDKRGRGSRRNYEYQHTHFYVYGSHHYLPSNESALRDKEDHLARLLQRNTNTTNQKHRLIKILPVGTGKYLYSDRVTPTSLYEYLQSPTTDPSRQNVINYIARNKNNPTVQYPLTYIYQEV